MIVRRLACVDAQGELLGYIVCDTDEDYARAIERIKSFDLPNQREGDLPTLEELASREENKP